MKKFVITGPDGSGKSTICAALAKRLEGALEVTIWDALKPDPEAPTPFTSKPDAERYLASLAGPSRTLFLMHALARAEERALAQRPKLLLWNGYWYKYAASEIALGVPPELVLGAARAFAPPTRVFYLDVSPETAWERRKAATAYEQGGASTTEPASRERFVSFQHRVRKPWAEFKSTLTPAWDMIPETWSIEQKVEHLLQAIGAAP